MVHLTPIVSEIFTFEKRYIRSNRAGSSTLSRLLHFAPILMTVLAKRVADHFRTVITHNLLLDVYVAKI